MSDRPPQVDRPAVDLLLQIMETPGASVTAAAIETLGPDLAAPLIGAGLLKSAGHEAAAVSMSDHDDAPVALTWSAEHNGYGYFSPTAGWVTVANDSLCRYRADMTAVIRAMLGEMQPARAPAPMPIVPELVWEVGDVHFGRLNHRTPVWFVRRLSDSSVAQQLIAAIRARPTARSRVILTSTPARRMPREAPVRHILVPIQDIIRLAGGLAVDPDIVSARICQTPAVDTDAPISILGDGREVRFYSEVFRFPKGVEQRQIIIFLHERYQQGELWVSNEAILAELNLGGTRVRDKFKKSPAWGRLLTERSGLIGFCWPDQI